MRLLTSDQQYVKDLVGIAGKKLLQQSNRGLLASKELGHLAANAVTQSDIDTENYLREKLEAKFPSIGFYSEESAKDNKKELEKEFFWVVDPIDGTLNFSRGLPFWGISLALFHKKNPEFGAIYFPNDDELYSAVKGEGAFQGENRLFIGERTNPNDLYAVIGHKSLPPQLQLTLFESFAREHLHVRGVGSAVYHLAHVAAGQYDINIGINLALWDIGAGWILVEEAGGKLDIFRKDEEALVAGDPYHLWYAAGNKTVVDWISNKIKDL